MTDHELLLAFSNIVQSHLEPVKEDIRSLKDDMKTVKAEIKVMQGEIKDLRADVNALKDDMNAMKAEMVVLKDDMKAMNGEMKVVKVLMENDIQPRLQNIESCYTSTYRRYAEGIEDLETLKTDMGIVKKVVSEHSEKLQRIS
mgnify:CR=1 FL=1